MHTARANRGAQRRVRARKSFAVAESRTSALVRGPARRGVIHRLCNGADYARVRPRITAVGVASRFRVRGPGAHHRTMARRDAADPYDLDRFLAAQEHDYPTALAEIRAGSKRSHWMWYVFPQLAGLGSSGTARRYAIRSAAEARAYLAHPVLGARLREIARAACEAPAADARTLMGSPDDLKLRSCATLFAHVSAPGSVFERVLDRWFGGEPDARTLELLRAGGEDVPA